MSRILLIQNAESPRVDRLSGWLARHGYELDWRSAVGGDPLPDPREDHRACVIYGGPMSANDGPDKPFIADQLDWIPRWLETGRPFLGICLGAQLLAKSLGAEVRPHPEGLHEIGYVRVEPSADDAGFMSAPMHVYQWHNEGFDLPRGAERLAVGPTFPNQAMRLGPRVYGLQFHAETTVDIFRRWMTEASHMLEQPGAHPPERQLADARRHDETLARWLDRFMSGWLGTADGDATGAGSRP